MNILAIADKNPRIDVQEFVQSNKVNLIVTLGDLTREDIISLKTITHIPKIGIYGNHCSGTYMPDLGIIDMHRMIWDFEGLRFGGFEGCVRYKENPQAIMYTQSEADHLMQDFPPVDIFLSHCPPYGINDNPQEIAHQGFHALRNYIDTTPPKIWLHGHTDPSPERLMATYGAVRIEYVYGYKLISLPESLLGRALT